MADTHAPPQVHWADAGRPQLLLDITSGAQAGQTFRLPPHLTTVRPCPASLLPRTAVDTPAQLSAARPLHTPPVSRYHLHPRTWVGCLLLSPVAPLVSQVTIGRVATTNDFAIHDAEVSSTHARVAWSDTAAAWQLVRRVCCAVFVSWQAGVYTPRTPARGLRAAQARRPTHRRGVWAGPSGSAWPCPPPFARPDACSAVSPRVTYLTHRWIWAPSTGPA